MEDIAKSKVHTKGLSITIARGLMLCALTVNLSGCVGSMDLFGEDKVDRSIATSAVASHKSDETLSDEMTVRNAVTSADVERLAGQPIPWANTTTGSAGVITAIREDSQSGPVCRQFATTRHSYQGIAKFQGTACLDGKDNWQLLSFQEAK